MAYAQLERGIRREMVVAGTARAKRESRRVGRPPITARDGFAERWAAVRADLDAGRISRSEAARRLDCGYATLLRLLEAGKPAPAANAP
jgi:DNA invertase Pin-like site-specific DNA recombinase